MNPEDRATRMRLVMVRVHAAFTPIDTMAGSGTWTVDGGQYSTRINDRWRLCFRFSDGDARDVEIVDHYWHRLRRRR